MGKGAGAAIGKAAFIADSILRGVMRGRQQHAEREAAKTDKLAKGLQFAYQNAANHYVDLVKGGADPNSKEVQEAGMAADAAWQSMMKMYGNYIMGDQDKKGKSKSKNSGKGGKGGDQPENPAELLMSQDPHDKIKGWFMISQKAGAPYKYQAQQYLTPEYKQDRANYAATQQTERDVIAKRNELHALQNMDPAKLDEKQKGRLEQLQSDQELFPQMAHTIPHYGTTDIPGSSLVNAKDAYGNPQRDKFGNAIDPKQNYRAETIGGQQTYVPSVARQSVAKPSTEQAFFEQVAKEAGIDTKDLSAESMLQLRNSFRSAGQMGHISNGVYIYTDDSGKVIQVPVTRSTSGGKVAVPGVSASPKPGEQSAPTAGAGGTGGGHAAHSGGVATEHLPGGAKVISPEGHERASAGAKSVRKAADSLRPLANLLSVQTEYMNDIKKDPSKANPRSDLAMIIAGVRAMNPGSVRLPNKELELELQAGSYDQRLRRWYDVASKGTLPDDQREQLFKIVHDETTKAGQNIVNDWRRVIKNEDVPSHLKQFDSGDSGGAPSGGDHPLTPEQEQVLDKYFPKKP